MVQSAAVASATGQRMASLCPAAVKRLRDGGEALGHACGEAEVDREGEARARSVEGARDRIEDGGVDQAVARAEAIAGDGEIGGVGNEG